MNWIASELALLAMTPDTFILHLPTTVW